MEKQYVNDVSASNNVKLVPQYSSLEEIPSINGRDRNRYLKLRDVFQSSFGSSPECFVRAPGRVNLIGEHVDYMEYSVLPLALEKDTVIAAGRIDTEDVQIVLVNLESDKYPKMEIKVIDGDITIDNTKHCWSNYVLAGIKSRMQLLGTILQSSIGFVVSGTVPAGSGLSSSSALVCASALATQCIFSRKLPRKDEIAAMCAEAEHYVGLAGGGMDQAISFLACPGAAMRIDFNPLVGTQVPLPNNAALVVAHSLVDSHKAPAAGGSYNNRVAECRSGCFILATLLNLLNPLEYIKLKHIQNVSGKTTSELVDIITANFHDNVYSIDEVSDSLRLSKEVLMSKLPVFDETFGLQLKSRLLHAVKESKRVFDFEATCNCESYPDQLKDLGVLMNDSHFSLRDNYECSCAGLDTLTHLCRNLGAYGSRLTGAGWGGATISLVDSNKGVSFVQALKESDYYKGLCGGKPASDDIVFLTKPAEGACIIKNI